MIYSFILFFFWLLIFRKKNANILRLRDYSTKLLSTSKETKNFGEPDVSSLPYPSENYSGVH